MICINNIRPDPVYRRGAFDAGLRKLGYSPGIAGTPHDVTDLLILWNRQGAMEALAASWELKGGTVIVCENGYIGQDNESRQLYAIAVHGHNGSGWFPVGDEDRFAALGIELEPWRGDAGYILVCGQRGIGSREMASPPLWEGKTAASLKAMGKTPIKLRFHPGRVAAQTPLENDLAGARMCSIWSSSSGVLALTRGIPVIYSAPHWICEEAAGKGLEGVEKPIKDDALRVKAMHRMSHGQWTVEEIESGEPFARILDQIGSAKWQ